MRSMISSLRERSANSRPSSANRPGGDLPDAGSASCSLDLTMWRFSDTGEPFRIHMALGPGGDAVADVGNRIGVVRRSLSTNRLRSAFRPSTGAIAAIATSHWARSGMPGGQASATRFPVRPTPWPSSFCDARRQKGEHLERDSRGDWDHHES